jgi:PPOX class probable F420-dependent enzyme
MPLEAPVRALLDARNVAHVGTVRRDGSVHVVPVWINTDGERVMVNSAEGRTWPRNLERDPRVTLTVTNLENPYEYAEIRGRVVERTHEDADEHIDALAKKYLGADSYPFRQPDEQRVKFVIAPEQVSYSAPG